MTGLHLAMDVNVTAARYCLPQQRAVWTLVYVQLHADCLACSIVALCNDNASSGCVLQLTRSLQCILLWPYELAMRNEHAAFIAE
jgi:hypothetical protein